MTDGRHARRTMLDETAADASLLVCAIKKPLPVLLAVPIAIAIGILVIVASPPSYTATAEILVEDVRSSDLFQVTDLGGPSTQQSERYLADQVALLRSSVAARRTADRLGDEVSERYILEEVAVDGDVTSNLIEITAPASTPEDAKELADTLALTYFDLREEQLSEAAASAIDEIDALLAVVDAELSDVRAQITEFRSADGQLASLDSQFDEALTRLATLRVRREAAAVGSVERESINLQIQEVLRDFEAFNTIFATNRDEPELRRLENEEAALTDQRLDLERRGNAISVVSELSRNTGARDLESVLPDEPDGPGKLTILAVFAVLGLAVGASISYVLVHRGARVDSRYEPAEVLDAPLLGTIPLPDLAEPGLAVVADSDGEAAYAYRFSASALDLRTADSAKVIMTVSAHGGRERSVIVANLAAAAALSGLRVMAVDADFQVQGLTRFLLGHLGEHGLIDFISSTVDADEVVHKVPIGGAWDISVMPQAPLSGSSMEALQSNRAGSLFAGIADSHDLVLLDAPSVLEAAYTAMLARFVEGLVVIVEHGMEMDDLEELAARLDLTGTPVLGYLYATRGRSSRRGPFLERRDRPSEPDGQAPDREIVVQAAR